MSLNFDKIKKANPKISNLIFGYFRESHKKYFDSDNPYYSLQPLLIYICIAFHFKHEWKTENMSDSIKINDDNVITKISRDDTTVLMKDTISSGLHEYEFKVIDCEDAFDGGWFDIVIGMVDADILKREHPDIETSYAFHKGYYYAGTTNKLSSPYYDRQTTIFVTRPANYNNKCVNGSIIKMRAILESDAMILQYFLNDISIGTITGIPNLTYAVGIYLYCQGTKIQLLR